MNKTKLGISTNLMAAFVFALAIVFTYVNSGFAIGLLLFATCLIRDTPLRKTQVLRSGVIILP